MTSASKKFQKEIFHTASDIETLTITADRKRHRKIAKGDFEAR